MGWVYPSKPTSQADFEYRWFDHSNEENFEGDEPWELQWYDDATMRWNQMTFFKSQSEVQQYIEEKK